jgi:N-acetyl-alpha-D-glucosaminyl L-malate synthase BshA
MNIGVVCYPTFGGSGVLATELGIGLAQRNHNIHFITYKRPARLNAFNANVYLHEVNSFDYPLFEYSPYETALASKLVDVVKYEKIDLLHVHYAIPHAAVAYMAKQILKAQGIDIPIVTTLHGTDITLVGADSSFRPVVEFSINNSDAITAVSNHLRDQTYTNFNINREIDVVYNFVDFNRFRKINKEHFKKAIAPDGERILVHTSNFRKVKRVDDVIRIFEIITKQVPSKLLLIGDGPERKNLEELCRQLGLCDDIRFLGKQDAIEELLSVADLFILPSENESFGLAALEAMACEVPIISSNAGGLPEVNIDGLTGYLCNVGDVEQMAKKALHILLNEDIMQKFRKNALSKAKEFEIEKIIPNYEAIYLRSLNK